MAVMEHCERHERAAQKGEPAKSAEQVDSDLVASLEGEGLLRLVMAAHRLLLMPLLAMAEATTAG